MLRALTRSALGLASAGVDRAFVRVAFQSRRASSQGTSGTHASGLDECAELYPRLAREGRLFPEPAVRSMNERAVRGLPGGEVVDLTWISGWTPHHQSYAELLSRIPQNTTAHARWWRHDRPSAAVLCIHGWGTGQPALEEVVFGARYLYQRGLDVLLLTLPFHARRGLPRQVRPPFPTAEPTRGNEGLAQAVLDARDLLAAVRAQGAPHTAVLGMSLGACTAALLGTVDDRPHALITMLPFGSLAELLWQHGEGTPARARAAEAGVDRERFIAAFRAVSALDRAPLVPPERVLLLAAEHDQITPRSHATRLAAHFQGRLELVQGSHLAHLGRGQAAAIVLAFLRARGLEVE